MKVYLATAGEYSDYRVEAVFARREDAEAYPLADGVEEFELHEGPVEVRTWYMLSWHAYQRDHQGDARHASNPLEATEQRGFDGRPDYVKHSWTDLSYGKWLQVEGWDLQRVRKVYSEQRAQYTARRDMGVEP